VTPTSALLPVGDGSYVPELSTTFARIDVGLESVVWADTSETPALLGPVARVMADVVDGIATVDALVADVEAVIGIPHDRASAQVWECLVQFAAAGILAHEGSGSDVVERRPDVFLTPPST